jgi:DNA-binding MarR family transcriptional regulator
MAISLKRDGPALAREPGRWCCRRNHCSYNQAMTAGRASSPAPSDRHRGAKAPAAASAPRGCSSLKVRRLSGRISQHFDRVIAETGLKTTQYALLNQVARLAPIRPGELAKAMGIDASTLTRNLQPLVAAGWLLVGRGDDARSRTVSMTPAGLAKRAEARRAWKRAQLSFNERLGVDAVARLHALVDECMARLEELDAPG